MHMYNICRQELHVTVLSTYQSCFTGFRIEIRGSLNLIEELVGIYKKVMHPCMFRLSAAINLFSG